MPRRIGLRARGAAMIVFAALTGGGSAAAVATAASASQLPDLNAASLASLQHTHNPALSAAVSRVLAENDTARPLYYGFNA
jgi:FXSXX-COOH protein